MKFEIAISICNLQFQITRVHNIHYMNLKGKMFFNQLWYGLHRFQIHFHLEIEIAVHLKEKVFFSLWYGLHHFQIQFHLQIEIAIWNFKLEFQFTHVFIYNTWIWNCISIEIKIANWNRIWGKFWQVHYKKFVATISNLSKLR